MLKKLIKKWEDTENEEYKKRVSKPKMDRELNQLEGYGYDVREYERFMMDVDGDDLIFGTSYGKHIMKYVNEDKRLSNLDYGF